jgi:glycosyltransferase involved in cell wall biosynthesis
MSNTLAYHTEAAAVQAIQWSRILVPTTVFAESVRALNPAAKICVVPYGLPEEMLREARSAPPPVWNAGPCIVRLPHRPDPRKGHREAIEGLFRALPKSEKVRLDISWLDEERYVSYRREIESLVQGLGVAPQVSFCSWLNGSEQWRATAESCALLQLGRFEESFGLSIVESILFGRPAVTRYQPAVEEIIGPSDLLIELANPIEWYTALNDYWSHRRHDHGDSDRHILFKSLSLELMATRYDRVLTSAIQEP